MKVKARHGLLMWHKGRRGRTTTTAEGASTSSEGGNDPPRITGRRGKVSVKKQIELVRRLREQEQQNGDSGAKKRAKPTKKETADLPEEEVLRRQVERRRKQAKSSLSKLFKESIHGDIPLLVVDGYNVIHKDDHAKRLMSTGEMRGAREYLLANLDEYAHLRGLHVRCVFDAEGAVGTETRQEGTAFGTEVVFVTDMSADEYIERDIARVIDDLEAPEVYIATGDRACGDTCGGLGALPLSASALLKDMEELKRRADRERERVNRREEAKGARKGIGRFSDSGTLEMLEQLRRGQS